LEWRNERKEKKMKINKSYPETAEGFRSVNADEMESVEGGVLMEIFIALAIWTFFVKVL
jgi:hypothetical protein